MGSGNGSVLKVLLYNIDILALPIVSLVYPVYASIRAIETRSSEDDRQWLTYWVLHSLITLLELTFAKILDWIPIWPYAKLVMMCWLVIPYFSGAAYVYEHFVRPFLFGPHRVNIWYVPSSKDSISKKEDVLATAEKYIDDHGTEELEKLIGKGGKSVHFRSRVKKNAGGFDYVSTPETGHVYDGYVD